MISLYFYANVRKEHPRLANLLENLERMNKYLIEKYKGDCTFIKANMDMTRKEIFEYRKSNNISTTIFMGWMNIKS